MFELIFGLLTFGYKGVRVLAGPLLRSKILWYIFAEFSMDLKFFFPNRKHIFPNSLINS